MTTTIDTRAADAGFRWSSRYQPVAAATLFVVVASALWTAPEWFAVVVAVAVVVTLGIPHGAADHLVVEAIDGRREGSRRRFIRNYVLAVFGAGLVWLASPPVALVGFLVASAHHFGQSDLASLQLGGRLQLVLQWSRGLLIVGLPLVAHLSTIAPVVDDLGGGDPTGWSWLADRWWAWSAALVVQHVLVGAVAARRIGDRAVVARESITVALLSMLFLTAHPLLGFAAYFGLWHSLGHLLVLAEVLGIRRRPVRSVMRLAAPLTGISLGGLALGWLGAVVIGRVDLLVPVMLVVVSMLTVPHLVVVEQLWRRR